MSNCWITLWYYLYIFSIAEIVNKIEHKMKNLEDGSRTAKASVDAIKGNEAQIAKQFIETQKNLQVMNEKHEKLVLQLKDRKNEIKKLEKKAKAEAWVLNLIILLIDLLDIVDLSVYILGSWPRITSNYMKKLIP